MRTNCFDYPRYDNPSREKNLMCPHIPEGSMEFLSPPNNATLVTVIQSKNL